MEASRKQTTSYQDKVIRQIEAAGPPRLMWWTEFEIGVLRKYYGKKDPDAIAKALGRTRGSIDSKAHEMGLTKK